MEYFLGVIFEQTMPESIRLASLWSVSFVPFPISSTDISPIEQIRFDYPQIPSKSKAIIEKCLTECIKMRLGTY